MRRQKCSQCATMLDVSALERGSKAACPTCGMVNVVGEVKVTKRSLKDSGGFQPKAGTRAKAAAPTRSRQRSDAPPERASRAGEKRAPWALIVGGGVVLVAVIVGAVMMGGGGDTGKSTGPGGETKASWWTKRTTQVAVASPDSLRQWLAEAKTRGYDEDPAWWTSKEHDLYKSLLRQDPQDEAANRYFKRKHLGEVPDFKRLWDAMNQSFSVLPDDMRAFVDKYTAKLDRGDRVWMSAEKFGEAGALLRRFSEWKKKRDANPAADKILKGIREARDLLKEHEFVGLAEGPFILLLGYKKAVGGETEHREDELREMGKRFTEPVKVVYAEFEKRFAKPLRLEPIPRGRYFINVVLDQPESFADFLRTSENYEVAGDVGGFFSPRTRWAGTLASKQEQLAPFVGPDLAHESVHQLQHYYSKDPKKKFEPNLFPEWNCIWFTEGLAEFLGGGVSYDAKTGASKFTGFPSRRVEFLQEMKDNGVPLIPLRELVQLSTFQSWQRYTQSWLAGFEEDEDMPETAGQWLQTQPVAKIMYAHSWYLTHFLNLAEKGAYAERYRDLLMTALRGKAKPEAYRKDKSRRERWKGAYEAFAEIYGLSDGAAWEKMQKKYKRYLNKALRAAKG